MKNRNVRLLLQLTLLLAVAAAGAGTRAHAQNVTPAGETGWARYDWNAQSGSGEKAAFAVEEGKILHVTAKAADDARFVKKFAVAPDSIYRLAVRVRTEGVGISARGAGLSASGILDSSPGVQGTSDWRAVEMYGKTGPAQREVSVTVGVGGYGSLNSGSAWFDDVQVDPVQSAPAGVHVAALEPMPPAGPSAGAARGSRWVMAAAAALGLLLLLGGFFLRRGPEGRRKEVAPPDGAGHGNTPRALGRTDAALMAVLAATGLVVSLWHLGGHRAPETGWVPAQAGDSATVELGREANLSRIYYYCGINEPSGDGSRFTLSARTPRGTFEPIASFTKDDVENWKYLDVDRRTSAVRLTADSPGGRLNEIAFVEKGSQRPIPGLQIGETTTSAGTQGAPRNLVDEQRAFEYSPSFRTGFYFDEIYFARSAWESLHGIEPFESTHPPLGKLIIAAGVKIFGMNPFGWRIAGALFGVALVPVLYLLGLKIFRNRYYAFCGALLLLVDFMRFAQTRAALIDVYGIFFILLMYYFLLDLFPGKTKPDSRMERSLFLAGLSFGLGAACKWIAVYAGGGAAVLILLRTVADVRRKAFPRTLGVGGFLGRRAAVSFLAFVVVPATVYLLAYIPYCQLPGPGHDLAGILRMQDHMLSYHRDLQATHPFSSPWWSWPLDLRPLWMYLGTGLPEGTASTIASFGNPAIWWLTIPAVAGATFFAVRRRDARMGVVLTALFFQYLPWVGIHRLAFIYHFFSAIPFVILCIVALLREAEGRLSGSHAVSRSYLGVAAALFLVFYPVLSGLEVPAGYVSALHWLPTWLF